MTGGVVVIIGLGRSGLACARTLAREGYRVRVVDSADSRQLRDRAAALPPSVDVQLGGYAEDIAAGAVMICPSPGVRWDAPELETARRLGVPVRSEMDLVFERCRGSVVGVTGTNGKTTTTALVAGILDRAGYRVHTGGNIGETMLDRLAEVRTGDWVVLELSSFQLESVAEPRCRIACVLNVTPDHLDRHGSFAAYVAAKQKIVRFATSDAVLGADDPVTRDMARLTSCDVHYFGRDLGGFDGATVRGDDVVSVEGGEGIRVLGVEQIPLFGAHNVLNVLAALAVSRAAGVAPAAIAGAVESFHAVPHRLQTVLDHAGILWVNDSKATNAESAIVALRSFGSRPIVWIGGGQSKGAVPDQLLDEVARTARYAILNGATAAELDAGLRDRAFNARRVVASLHDAVAVAAQVAQPGEVVLLAPGYASFDQFSGFDARGDAFTAAVSSLFTPLAEPR